MQYGLSFGCESNGSALLYQLLPALDLIVFICNRGVGLTSKPVSGMSTLKNPSSILYLKLIDLPRQ